VTPQATLLLLFTMLTDTCGQLSLKAAAVSNKTGWERWKHIAANKWLWIGIFAYVFEFFSWLAFLSAVPLFLAVMVGSINIVLVSLGGKIFFKETMSRRRTTAVCLIALGVAVAGWA
jgi:drug/metabolite transporter (DMT)-like permease